MQTIVYILPELFLSLAIMFLLMLGVFIKKSFKLVSFLTILSLIFAIVLILNQPSEIVKIFNGGYIIDRLSIFMKVLTLLFCCFVLLSSRDYVKSNNIDKIEYPIIILLPCETLKPSTPSISPSEASKTVPPSTSN